MYHCLPYSSAKLWDCETGECIKTFVHHGPVRGAAFSDGSNMLATISDPFVEHNAQISVYDIPENDDPANYPDTPRVEIDLPKIDGSMHWLLDTHEDELFDYHTWRDIELCPLLLSDLLS